MAVWFVEVPRNGGGWAPQLYHGEKPSETTSAGTRRKFRREPVRVPDNCVDLPLTQLQALLSGTHEQE
jgi:hypothetical protein